MCSSTTSPANITAEAFGKLLARYPSVIAAVSEAKGAKPGQKTLAELDTFRYTKAPATYSSTDGGAMTKSDVVKLVEWKLRHGKFRPTLMKLVESNSESAVEATVEEAVAKYRSTVAEIKGGVKLSGHVEAALAAVKVLSTMRGIGPATASLLAAVHFPKECIFFSDEAYAWLAGGSSHSPPSKYNIKEYEDVARGMVQLLRRLPDEYGAQDVEQVAYVLMYDKTAPLAGKSKEAAKEPAPAKALKKETAPPAKLTAAKQSQESKKRKVPPTEAAVSSSDSVRRSSRHKSS
ncbi:hypothetical protein SBRCBS47491_006841 [Sporothrix bragantina]|uniref:ADA HAT complex component 1 n=1 Tax=Sporothrix bragantina TaxID=671064 RepID=A0ABP0C8L5_9PEZI